MSALLLAAQHLSKQVAVAVQVRQAVLAVQVAAVLAVLMPQAQQAQ
jgi:hypothetical protein